MADMQKMSDYLAECRTFYVATIDDGAPAVRPIGFQMCYEGNLYLGIGTHKAVYAQIQVTPKISIAATKPDGKSWIRISGTAVCDADPALVDAAFEAAPYLKPLYESNGWEMGVFHLENAKATWVENLMAPVRTEEF